MAAPTGVGACGAPLTGIVVARDATLILQAPSERDATLALQDLLQCWRDGMDGPLPIASRTALAWLGEDKPEQAYEGSNQTPGEVNEPCLGRTWPDYATLTSAHGGRFYDLASALYDPLRHWLADPEMVQLIPHRAIASQDDSNE